MIRNGCLFFMLVLLPLNALAQLPENFSYGRYLTSAEDQLRQGPCETFAAVGGVEAFYNLLYRGWSLSNPAIDLSEREVYVCGGNPTEGIGMALRYVRDYGVIPRTCYKMPTDLSCNEDFADPGTTRTIFNYDEKSTKNCPADQTTCSAKFRVKAQHIELTTQLTTNDAIKRALLERGPIAVAFYDDDVIHDAYHGYLLYGWETQNGITYWLLRDSWPCKPGGVRSSVNLAGIFADTTKSRQAYAITSVTGEKWNGSAWIPEVKTVLPFELDQGRQSAKIVPPANACMNQGQYGVTGLPPGASVIGWSLRTTSYLYSDAKISSSGVLSGNGADITVIALLRRPNGLLENITLPLSTVGIVHTVETSSYCPNPNQREIDLRLVTRKLPGYSYTETINLPTSSDGTYTITGNGTGFVHVVSRMTQAITYGTTVTAKQTGNPACTRTSTVSNRHVVSMPCSYY